MKTKLLCLAVILVTHSAFSGVNYFSASSSEARLEFEARIELEPPVVVSQTDFAHPEKMKKAKAAITSQLNFLIGFFQSKSFVNTYRYPGTLSDQKSIEYRSLSVSPTGKQILTYQFKGKALFNGHLYGREKNFLIPLKLPLNPATIYKSTLSRNFNPCSHGTFNAEEDFFFFWDAGNSGCSLRNNKALLVEVDGKFESLANTTLSYPEYDRLYSLPELKISLFIGYLDPVSSRVSRGDDGYHSFTEIFENLKRLGFKVSGKNEQGANVLATLEKTLTNKLGTRQRILVSMLLADSNSKSDKTFETAYAEALVNSQIVTYDGHSGAGGYLHLQRFPNLKLNPSYQVFFFNGCSTYSFFNDHYLSSKPGGSRNLEIITAGLLTYPDTSSANMMAFLQTFLTGELKSYQTILKDLEESNDGESTYLMGVNGDNDNLFKR